MGEGHEVFQWIGSSALLPLTYDEWMKGKTMRLKKLAATCTMLSFCVLAFASTSFAAPHHPTGEFSQFGDCPLNRATVTDCVYSVTSGGSVKLGNKTVPIKNPVTLQGGFEGGGEELRFFGAEDGNTLSKTPQPVPGGLAGLVKCNEISNFILRLGCEATFENGLTGVNATLELAAPATQVKLNTENLIFEEGTALQLPVKIHLENPFLGSSCYVGSNASPIVIPLTTGTSGSLKGTSGKFSSNELFTLLTFSGNRLVNNTFTAPGVSGCGGPIVELLIDPIVNTMIGLPAGSGTNSATLEGTTQDAASSAVRESE
jgi:hypothetical protein